MAGDIPAAALAEAVKAVKAAAIADGKAVATRKSSEITLDAITLAVPEMLGGSADPHRLQQHPRQGPEGGDAR